MFGADTSRVGPIYPLFFAPLEVEMRPDILESIQTAYIFSKYGHSEQRRDDGGRYFDHPKGAAWIYVNELNGRDPRIIIDILLHDMSEDSRLLSSYRISHNFGKEIALDVRAVTKLPKGKEGIKEYLNRVIARGPWAITAKLCDRLHNVRTLDACSKEKRERQIKETRDFYLTELIPALKRCGKSWRKLVEDLETKIEKALELAEKVV